MCIRDRDGTFEQFKAYVDAHAEQNPSCLCFTGEAEKLGVPCVEYGREGDGADQAKHIFRCLRALDEQGDAVVYARCPQKMCIRDRAYRAWQTAQDHLAQAKALLEEPGALDPDFKQMIQQEISEKSQDVDVYKRQP